MIRRELVFSLCIQRLLFQRTIIHGSITMARRQKADGSDFSGAMMNTLPWDAHPLSFLKAC
jgi:hypothetical protein